MRDPEPTHRQETAGRDAERPFFVGRHTRIEVDLGFRGVGNSVTLRARFCSVWAKLIRHGKGLQIEVVVSYLPKERYSKWSVA